MKLARSALASLLLGLAGCGGGSPAIDTGAPGADTGGAGLDGGTPEADAGGAGTDAGGLDAGGPPSLCDFVDALDRSCTVDGDCVVRVHQIDCCGSSYAIGLHLSQIDAFAAGEGPCRDAYPACGCPAEPIMTDSGEPAFAAEGIQAACVSRGPRNVCVTYVTMRPPAGR